MSFAVYYPVIPTGATQAASSSTIAVAVEPVPPANSLAGLWRRSASARPIRFAVCAIGEGSTERDGRGAINKSPMRKIRRDVNSKRLTICNYVRQINIEQGFFPSCSQSLSGATARWLLGLLFPSLRSHVCDSCSSFSCWLALDFSSRLCSLAQHASSCVVILVLQDRSQDKWLSVHLKLRRGRLLHVWNTCVKTRWKHFSAVFFMVLQASLLVFVKFTAVFEGNKCIWYVFVKGIRKQKLSTKCYF